MSKFKIGSRHVLLAIAGAIVLVIGAALWWGLTPLGPGEGALAALKSDATVTVTHAPDGWEFAPAAGVEPTVGLVFYPGGHVDARSYAPYARAVAERGYLVVIPVMPFSLAVFAPDAADAVIAAHPGIDAWAVGGHSLGGAMAAQYAAKKPDTVRGIVLLASYTTAGSDLSRSGIRALTLIGTQDTVVRRANLVAGRALLPSDAEYLELPGGNHAQFGDYGLQGGDDPNPTMNAATQLGITVDRTVNLLEGIAPR